MSYSLPTNCWISVPGTWRLNFISHSACAKFVFYHVRPAGWKVALAEYSGTNRNETQIIEPLQVSLIAGLKPGFFVCWTVTSPHCDRHARIAAKDYMTYLRLGQAKTWYMNTSNFFLGDFEVFNGPNPIDLSRP